MSKIMVEKKVIFISIFLNIFFLVMLIIVLCPERNNNRIENFEKYVNLNKFEFMGVGINENMTIKQIRNRYYSFKSYPQHEYLVNTILEDICD